MCLIVENLEVESGGSLPSPAGCLHGTVLARHPLTDRPVSQISPACHLNFHIIIKKRLTPEAQ